MRAFAADEATTLTALPLLGWQPLPLSLRLRLLLLCLIFIFIFVDEIMAVSLCFYFAFAVAFAGCCDAASAAAHYDDNDDEVVDVVVVAVACANEWIILNVGFKVKVMPTPPSLGSYCFAFCFRLAFIKTTPASQSTSTLISSSARIMK